MKTIKLNKEKVSRYIIDTQINDLNLIDFLRKSLGKDLILHSIDEIKMVAFVKESENSKIFEFPATLFNFGDEELNEEENKEQNQENNVNNFGKHKNKIIIIGIGILVFGILTKNFIFSNASDLTTGQPVLKVKNEFEILTEKINKNNELKAIELATQKELRKQINSSIEVVKKLDTENKEINNNLLYNANNIGE